MTPLHSAMIAAAGATSGSSRSFSVIVARLLPALPNFNASKPGHQPRRLGDRGRDVASPLTVGEQSVTTPRPGQRTHVAEQAQFEIGGVHGGSSLAGRQQPVRDRLPQAVSLDERVYGPVSYTH